MRLNLSASWRISIHALRGEGDKCGLAKEVENCISIHALRGEGDDVHHIVRVKQD